MSQAKIGTLARLHNRQYEVVSIHQNGNLVLRPHKSGRMSNGARYELGEKVKVIGIDQDEVLDGVITSVSPVKAKVVTVGIFHGVEVCGWKLRKGGPNG